MRVMQTNSRPPAASADTAARPAPGDGQPFRPALSAVPVSVWVFMASALALRIAFVLLRGDFTDNTAMEHDALATSLLLGDGFAFGDWENYGPSSVQSPPYPLLIAALFWIFGTDAPAAYMTAQLINAVVGALLVPATYLMVRSLHGSHGVALIAAALMVIWPTQLLAVAYVQAVTLITFCTVTIVVLWYRATDSGELVPWVLFGLIGCIGALTEPVLLPPMALAGLLIFTKANLTFTARLRNAAVLLGCAIVIIGPWTYRNYVVHGGFMPIKSTFWVNVWKGNNPNDASGTDRPSLSAARLAAYQEQGVDVARQYDLLSPEQYAELRGQSDIKREAIFKRYTTTFIAENPGGYLERCLRRLGKTLFADWDHPAGRASGGIYFGVRGILLIGSVIGLVLAWRRGWRMGWPALMVVSSVLMYTLTITAARFAFPLEPFQIALTSLAIWTLLAWIVGRKRNAGAGTAGEWETRDARPFQSNQDPATS